MKSSAHSLWILLIVVPTAVCSPQEGLFDVILESIESGADHMTVTYDSNTGAPAEIFIDSIEAAVDDELTITVIELSDD